MSDSTATPRTRKRFIVLALLFGCVWINYMNRTNISIAGTTMRDDLGIDPLKMGLIFSAFSWTYGWLQIPGGAMVDVFRTRKFYAVIMFFWSAMTTLTGFANSLASLIGLRLGLGLFQAPSYPAHNKMVTRWFPTNERATAIAVYTSAQFLVLAFMPIIFVGMMNAVTWRGLFIITGLVSILGSFAMYAIYRDPKDHKSVNQAELDYIEEGGGLVHDGGDVKPDTPKEKFNWADLAEAFKHRKLWGVYIGQFCLGSLFVFFLTWFPSYLKDTRGLSLESMGWWVMIPPLGAFVGVLLSGTLSDLLVKRGVSPGTSRKIPVLCGMVLGSSIIGANYTDSTGVVVFFMTIALFGNGLASIAWVFISSIAPIRCMGLVGGVFNFIGNLAGISLPIIVGYLARDGNFESGLIYIAVVSIIGFCSYLFLVGKVERIEIPER
jgi:ACS family D-galactonate transporter-like MFS transporter